MTIVANLVARGNYKWKANSFMYKGIPIQNLDFNVKRNVLYGIYYIYFLFLQYVIFYHDSNIACIFLTGKVMTYISVNIAMIQSRTKSITRAQLTTAHGFFRNCNIRMESWVPIEQASPTC